MCRYRIFCLFLFVSCFLPFWVSAQGLYQESQGVWRAEVLDVTNREKEILPGTDVEVDSQILEARFLEGEKKGEVVVFRNDYIQLDKGDTFYLNYIKYIDGEEVYAVREVDRRGAVFFIAGLFILAVIALGGWHGFRSLISLLGSLLVIVFILVPALVKGYSPIPVSVAVAGVILFFAIFFTYGFNRRSLVAYGGTIIAVFITGLLAYFSINIASLSGFSSDESVYLNLGTGGQLDFVGLLLAAIIIGFLGVLDDIAITQVAVVRELFSASKKLSKRQVYKKALRVGRDHVGALVNTLVLAYTGAALPLLLLFSLSDSSFLSIINREVFATEIVRSLIGSIGLVLTVPITTFLAVMFLDKKPVSQKTEKKEN